MTRKITIQLCPKLPPALTSGYLETPVVNSDVDIPYAVRNWDNMTLVIPLIPESGTNSNIEISTSMLKEIDNYILSVFGFIEDPIYWERSSTTYGEETLVTPFTYLDAGITICFSYPGEFLNTVPWFFGMDVRARNPELPIAHAYDITARTQDTAMELIDDPDSIWKEELSAEYEKDNITNIQILPGEYLIMTVYCNIEGRREKTPQDIDDDEDLPQPIQVKYETPLFTGGWITAKSGEGVDVKYTVKIFEKEYENIVPTDFYNYEVDTWVYLLKDIDVLFDEEEYYGKQMYSSSDIDSSSPISDYSTVFNEINNERTNEGLSILKTNPSLQAVAQAHAEDMAANKFVGHSSSDGTSTSERLMSSDYLSEYDFEEPGQEYALGENVAGHQNPNEVVEDWMGSPGHKANILSSAFTECGIGIAQDSDGLYYFAQEFGLRSDKEGGFTYSYYRIVPFNFSGAMSSYCGIPASDAIYISMSSSFEEVFDMVKYEGEISNINLDEDTANITFTNKKGEEETQENISIFYYCSEEHVIEGGSIAFTDGDLVIVEVPWGNIWGDAKIIGFSEGLKECGELLIIYHSEDKVLVWQISQNQLLEYYDNSGTIVSGLVSVSSVSNFLNSRTSKAEDLFTVTERLEDPDMEQISAGWTRITTFDFPDYEGSLPTQYDVSYEDVIGTPAHWTEIISIGERVSRGGFEGRNTQDACGVLPSFENYDTFNVWSYPPPELELGYTYNYSPKIAGSLQLECSGFISKSIGISLIYFVDGGTSYRLNNSYWWSDSTIRTLYEYYSCNIYSPFNNGYLHNFTFQSEEYESVVAESVIIPASGSLIYGRDRKKRITKYINDVFSKKSNLSMVVINPVEVKQTSFINNNPIHPIEITPEYTYWAYFAEEDYIETESDLIPKKVSVLLNTNIDVDVQDPYDLPYSGELELILNNITEDITSIDIV